jgi:hypothetical protein
MSEKTKLKNVLSVLPFIFSIFFLTQSNAQTKTVSISVKLSVCGDGIVEGKEDCESLDLNGASCESLGFKEGELLCDPSCSFNTTNCIPFPEPEPEPIPDAPRKEAEEGEQLPDEITDLINIEQNEDTAKREFLDIFDEDGDGILTSDEIPVIVVKWINAWSKSDADPVCDLNEDTKCNIYDFSILLYLIDNTDI